MLTKEQAVKTKVPHRPNLLDKVVDVGPRGPIYGKLVAQFKAEFHDCHPQTFPNLRRIVTFEDEVDSHGAVIFTAAQ